MLLSLAEWSHCVGDRGQLAEHRFGRLLQGLVGLEPAVVQELLDEGDRDGLGDRQHPQRGDHLLGIWTDRVPFVTPEYN